MRHYARMQDGLVVELASLADDVDVADAFHPDLGFEPVAKKVVVGWVKGEGGTFGAPPKMEPEPDALPDLAPWQFRAVLEIHGLVDKIDAAVEAIPDLSERAVARAKLDYALIFQRSDPLFASLGPAVGLSESDTDAMWAQGAALS